MFGDRAMEDTEYPYTVYLNDEVYGHAREWGSEDTKDLLTGGNRRSNHVKVYCFDRIVIDIVTEDLANLPNY